MQMPQLRKLSNVAMSMTLLMAWQ